MVAIVCVAAMAMAQTAKEWLDKAIEYRKMGEWEKAIEATHEALELEPNNKYTHANLGWYYDEVGDHETAVDHCNKAIGIDETFAQAYNNRGWSYFLMGDYTSALEDVSKSITYIDDGDALRLPATLVTRANIYFEMESFNEAMKDVERTIELTPDYAWASYTRGIINEGLGESGKAKSSFEYACEKGCKKPVAPWMNQGIRKQILRQIGIRKG